MSVGKYKRLNLAKKRDILEKVCKVSNLKNLKPEGPYGEACVLLKIKNTHANRKRIQTFWQRHFKTSKKSNEEHQEKAVNGQKKVKEISRTVHSDGVQGQSKQKVEISIGSASKCALGNSESVAQKLPLKIRQQSTSRRKYKAAKSSTTQFCLCGSNSKNWGDKGAMVECEACNNWYHFECICKKSNIKVDERSDVKFVCGLNNCTFHKSFLMVQGTIYPVEANSSTDVFDSVSKIIMNTTDENGEDSHKNLQPKQINSIDHNACKSTNISDNPAEANACTDV